MVLFWFVPGLDTSTQPQLLVFQVSVEGKANPVSLLQMASSSGLCVLVRLSRLVNSGRTIPKTLLDILADSAILKVGVGCWEDACKLLQDYGLAVKGSVDLRYLAMRQRCVPIHRSNLLVSYNLS